MKTIENVGFCGDREGECTVLEEKGKERKRE
jgi:hypothetical protein